MYISHTSYESYSANEIKHVYINMFAKQLTRELFEELTALCALCTGGFPPQNRIIGVQPQYVDLSVGHE